MNHIEHINLGGHPFKIDVDAHDRLDRYITSLEQHFKHTDSGEEILSDIETRIAELFEENMGSGRIVTVKLVIDTIQIMGTPEAIYSDNSNDDHDNKFKGFGIETGKKLFRDPDQKIVGGVCSGLAQYFGIPDPVWIRGLFALIFFAGGSGFLAYIVLWAIVPQARTAADRLAMQGKKINVDSIADTVREQFEDLEHKFHEFKNK